MTLGQQELESTDQARILVVDDHDRARQSICDVLSCAGYQITDASGGAEALTHLESQSFDVIITDLKMPGMDGLEFVRAVRGRDRDIQIVMVTAHASVASAVEAMRHGVYDYLEKPLQADELERLVSRALRKGVCVEYQATRPSSAASHSAGEMIGRSDAMRKLREQIAMIGPTDETVLVTGESGTGKELVAREIHVASRRSGGTLVSLNCPVLSAQLMESELFGHTRGAFTSADASRVGRFELANEGTILLDEITEIELPMQAKLLRVLQERTFERVGSSETVHVDVRVIATTNRDLREAVEQGTFREDLFFRLAVVLLEVPPLRNRRDDVPLLIDYFATVVSHRLQREPCRFDSATLDMLSAYHWPGNVRELENLVTRASVLTSGDAIGVDELRTWLIDPSDQWRESETEVFDAADTTFPIGTSLQEMEQRLIESTLEHYEGHRQKTADALGIGVRTLSGKLRSYGLAPRARTFSKAA